MSPLFLALLLVVLRNLEIRRFRNTPKPQNVARDNNLHLSPRLQRKLRFTYLT